jgi:hypothetical protein
MEKRTGQQNKALHLYFTHLAQSLNDAGYNVQLILSHAVEVDWTPDLVKELLWRIVQQVTVGKVSTTELNKQQEIDRCTAS